jgi:peptidoglycan/LPS O-acetylase OafA/YrhL
MELISTLFVIPILILVLGCIAIVAPIVGIEAPNHRYSSIDGLRGFLAILVFLHHSSSWYYFTRSHQWGIIPSGLFNHFGSTSVAMFFMITAFLFFSKLIEANGRPFDWLKLYVSRAVRIVPLYVLAVLALFLMVGFVTHFTRRESIGSLMLELGKWLLIMETDVNRMVGTKFIVCGVQWSLAYEWFFYCSLALIGRAFFRLKTSLVTILLAGLFLGVFGLIIFNYYPARAWWRMSPFISGLAAAFIARNRRARQFFSDRWVSPILLLLLTFALFYYPHIFSPVPLFCVTLVFIGIACGNDLFGILIWKPCRQLGQISYSIYLLHGLILFSAFYFALGFGQAAILSVVWHWLIISICSIFVVIVCSFTYYYIERPGTDSAAAVTKRIRQFFGWGLPRRFAEKTSSRKIVEDGRVN